MAHLHCYGGNHEGPTYPDKEHPRATGNSHGWREVPAHFKEGSDTEVYYDADSIMKVWVCPDHKVEGEPGQ